MKPTILTEIPAINIRQPENYVGKFNVISKKGVRKFTILDLALNYYNELKEEASVWDVTGNAELIKLKCNLKETSPSTRFINTQGHLS